MKGVSTLANEPVNSGEKVQVGDEEGTVVRGVAIRGGYEYTVRVKNPDAAANETLKLPPGYNPVAAFGTEEQADIHEENRKRDEEEREELDKALNEEREEYTNKERELSEKLRKSNEDNDHYDAGVGSHLVAAQATGEVDAERAKRGQSSVDGAAKADSKSREEKLRGVSTSGSVDEHGSNLANQDQREKAAPGYPGTGKAADAKAAKEGQRNR